MIKEVREMDAEIIGAHPLARSKAAMRAKASPGPLPGPLPGHSGDVD